MADDISGASDGDVTSPAHTGVRSRDTLVFSRIVVIGGGCYGHWYTSQLARAAARGALQVREVIVVDHNADCRVVQSLRAERFGALPVTVVQQEWADFLVQWLAAGPEALAHDAMVPSPLMPHVCLDWLISRSRARWPDREAKVVPLPRDTGLPWERASPDGRHYVSFATWMCPINCIEPARCPETRDTRHWSMPPALQAYVATASADGVVCGPETDARPLRGPVIFHCVHRTYGVGMIDAAAIAQADIDIAQWGAEGSLAVLVGTVSHCHGALGVLHIA